MGFPLAHCSLCVSSVTESVCAHRTCAAGAVCNFIWWIAGAIYFQIQVSALESKASTTYCPQPCGPTDAQVTCPV